MNTEDIVVVENPGVPELNVAPNSRVPELADDDTMQQILDLQKERSGQIYDFVSDIRQADVASSSESGGGFMPVLAYSTDANVSSHIPSLSPLAQNSYPHSAERNDDEYHENQDEESEGEDIEKLESDNAERIRKEREEIMSIVQNIQHTDVDVRELMGAESFMNNSGSANVDKVTVQQALDDVRKQKTEIEKIEDAIDKQELLQAQIQFRLDRMTAERAAVQHNIRVKQDRICQLYDEITYCNKAVEVWLPRDITNQRVRSQNLEDQYRICLDKQAERQKNLKIYLEHLQNNELVKMRNDLQSVQAHKNSTEKQIKEEEQTISICELVNEQLQMKNWELKKRVTGINNYNATVIQSWWRTKTQQKRFKYAIRSIARIQKFWRDCKQRKLTKRIEAAVKIQSTYRGHRTRKMLKELKQMIGKSHDEYEADIETDEDILDFMKDKDGDAQMETDDEVNELISNMQDMKLHKIVTPMEKMQKDWGFKNELTALWALRKQQRFEHVSGGSKRKQMLKDPMTRLDAFYRINNKGKSENHLPPLPNSAASLTASSQVTTIKGNASNLQETYKKMSDFKLPFLQTLEESHNQKQGSFPGDKPTSS